jgi:hypothetical protein
MVIIVVAGPQEGKSGAAYWLSEQLKKLGAQQVIVHDNDTTSENYSQVIDNNERIMSHVVVQQPIHIVTKQRPKNRNDANIAEAVYIKD